MAAGEQVVELVVRVAELIETEFPDAHVLEGALGVLPGDEPVGAGEGHHQEEAAEEGGDAGPEQGL